MTSTASINREHDTVTVMVSTAEAEILAYALRHFVSEMAGLDPKAKSWALQMKRIATDISNAIKG